MSRTHIGRKMCIQQGLAVSWSTYVEGRRLPRGMYQPQVDVFIVRSTLTQCLDDSSSEVPGSTSTAITVDLTYLSSFLEPKVIASCVVRHTV